MSNLVSVPSLPSYFNIAELPPILTAWASIIPLACHLAPPTYRYKLVGQVALSAKLSPNLFPKLGFLRSVYLLLHNGQRYCDEASSRAGLTSTGFDINFGSVFPVANGAACRMIVDHAIHQQKSLDLSEGGPRPKDDCGFRRSQTLHVLYCHRRTGPQRPWPVRAFRIVRDHPISRYVNIATRISAAVALGLAGCYGTSSVLLAACVTSLICDYLIEIARPGKFLENNEDHNASMLMACHANASEWFLLHGDRGIVDTILNKPMIFFRKPHWSSRWFLIAEYIQLLAMTFVTAVQGLDGFCMVLLMLYATLLEGFDAWDPLSARWMDKERICVKTAQIALLGRTQMVGALYMHSLSDTTAWMDSILVPNPRRQVWLEHLRVEKHGGFETWFERCAEELSEEDRAWSDMAVNRSKEIYGLLQSALMSLSFETIQKIDPEA